MGSEDLKPKSVEIGLGAGQAVTLRCFRSAPCQPDYLQVG
jgi:hypothetical protein